MARANRGCIHAVRAVRDDGGRGSVLRGHRPSAVSRDGKCGQLRGGRGSYVVPVCRGRRPVGLPRTVRCAGNVSIRVSRCILRAPVRRSVRYRVRSVREDMYGRAPEQRTGQTQRVRARPLAAATTAASAATAAAAATATTVSTTATTAAVQ